MFKYRIFDIIIIIYSILVLKNFEALYTSIDFLRKANASQPADKGNGPIPIIHATRFPAFRPISLLPSLHLQSVRFFSVCFAPPKATDGTTIFPSPESYMVTNQSTPQQLHFIHRSSKYLTTEI